MVHVIVTKRRLNNVCGSMREDCTPAAISSAYWCDLQSDRPHVQSEAIPEVSVPWTAAQE